MPNFLQKPLSRRSAIVGALSALPLLRLGEVAANQYDPIQPIDLGHGLEIRDYRLFPTEDVMRFIVEIHNTTDAAVDTPSVGVVLPHLEGENFGWANPVSQVLHPHTSNCLIGIAPAALSTDLLWANPDWLLCSEIGTDQAEWLNSVKIEYSYTFDFQSSTHLKILVEFTNHGLYKATDVVIQGTVWDVAHRLCGATMPLGLANLGPGQSARNAFNITPIREYHANPFALIDTVEGIDVDFTIQPTPPNVNNGCETILPWARIFLDPSKSSGLNNSPTLPNLL